ncbi:MAG: hypothetical protein KDD69_05635, partial [Bdellovibrionales bacterium]|nr:hypothetical protein [Bdellovibrionales bacterium]
MNFLPSQASTFAVETDAIFLALLGLTVFFTSLVFGLIGYFCWRYRAGRVADRTSPPHGNRKLESGLTVVLLLLSLVVFFWAATHYVRLFDVPDDAEPIFVVGRQWMWQAYHRNGRRELNQLHLSSKKPVRLYLVSEDVIHSFFVPAFRIKIDVLPGRYTQVWFEPTR